MASLNDQVIELQRRLRVPSSATALNCTQSASLKTLVNHGRGMMQIGMHHDVFDV